MKKRGAMELSVGTIVIIVLSMTMLILGVMLITNLFGGSTENIDTINDNVKDRINELFGNTNRKLVINLAQGKADIPQGEQWGVAFAIKNTDRGAANSETFNYEVKTTENTCQYTEEEMMRLVSLGKSDNDIPIAAGETYYGLIRFEIPESTPLCSGRYRVDVSKGTTPYASDSFDIFVE